MRLYFILNWVKQPLSLVFFAACLLTGCSEKPDPRTTPEAEATRLYDRATNFVSTVTEGNYSYSYMQFYWMRAQSNVERIDRTYGDTPTAKRLRNGELKLGPYDLTYFHERVLPRLKQKQEASFNQVNCAIFLWLLPQNKENNTPVRQETLRWIVEYMSRADRFSEVLALAIGDEDRPILLRTVARVGAVYHKDKMIDQLLKDVGADERPDLIPVIAEAHAFRGDPLTTLDQFVQDNGNLPQVQLGVLRGIVRRESALDRTVAEKRPLKSAYDGIDVIQKPDMRTDVELFAKEHFPKGDPESAKVLALYRRRQELPTDPMRSIFELARLGQTNEAEKAQAAFAQQNPEASDMALYQLKRGQVQSFVTNFVVQPDTFSSLAIKDPNLIAQLILEWSLTPNRNQRGMAPYDQVVYRFSPGFDDLPLPELPKEKS